MLDCSLVEIRPDRARWTYALFPIDPSPVAVSDWFDAAVPLSPTRVLREHQDLWGAEVTSQAANRRAKHPSWSHLTDPDATFSGCRNDADVQFQIRSSRRLADFCARPANKAQLTKA